MPRVIYLNESRIVTRVTNFIFIDTESGKTLLDFFEHLKKIINSIHLIPYSTLLFCCYMTIDPP